MSITEVAAFRGPETALAEIMRAGKLEYPALGRCAIGCDALSLSVRPQRVLILSAAGEAAGGFWRRHCGAAAAVIDLEGGLCPLMLRGAGVAELLARSCRLDPRAYLQPGVASATLIAQVSAILVALRAGLLLLIPSTYAQHLQEWLTHNGAQEAAETALTETLVKERV